MLRKVEVIAGFSQAKLGSLHHPAEFGQPGVVATKNREQYCALPVQVITTFIQDAALSRISPKRSDSGCLHSRRFDCLRFRKILPSQPAAHEIPARSTGTTIHR
jgi:hypothetical protein